MTIGKTIGTVFSVLMTLVGGVVAGLGLYLGSTLLVVTGAVIMGLFTLMTLWGRSA